MSLTGVPEFSHQRMAIERLLHDAALDAFSAAVNQSHFPKPRRVCRDDVFLDDGPDIAWCEGVEVEMGFDRDMVRHSIT